MSVLEIHPARTALVNVDMQRCFVEDSPLASPDGLLVLERINLLAAACRKAGVLIVHTRGWMRADGSNLGVMGELVPPFIVALYTQGSDTAELHPGLEVAPEDIILDKPRYGAFHATDLELILRSRGIDTIIVSGIATNFCCETTAREAAQRDFRVIFLSDGTATKEWAVSQRRICKAPPVRASGWCSPRSQIRMRSYGLPRLQRLLSGHGLSVPHERKPIVRFLPIPCGGNVRKRAMPSSPSLIWIK